MTAIAKVTAKGQTTIPRPIRAALDVKPGDLIAWDQGPDGVVRVRRVVEAIGCPVVAPDLGAARWVELMLHDKKAEGGSLRFVLMPRIGEAIWRGVDPAALGPVLERTVMTGTRS